MSLPCGEGIGPGPDRGQHAGPTGPSPAPPPRGERLARIALPALITPGPPPPAPIVRLAGRTMGTTWSIAFAARLDPDIVARAIAARLDDLVAQLSHWEPAAALGRFNRAAAGGWHPLPPDLAHVVATALEIAGLSGGAFDPAIGRLVDLHGHGPPGPRPAPSDSALAEALAAGGWRRLAYDPAARRLRQPGGLALDLSGIAKGHAVDAIGTVLAGLGARDWLVEIGGELKGAGLRPDGDPWWVDLEALPGLPLPPLRIALHGLAVATSGDYVRGAHTIDPRTGRAAMGGVRAVSVVHASAMRADAWATALFVLGPDEGPRLAAHHGLAARIVTSTDELISPALARMLAD